MKNNNDLPPDDLIPLGRAAAILSITTRTLYRWVCEGKLEAWMVGGRVRVSEELVRGMIRRRGTPKPYPRKQTKAHVAALTREEREIYKRHGMLRYVE